jgi:hypothetical protein
VNGVPRRLAGLPEHISTGRKPRLRWKVPDLSVRFGALRLALPSTNGTGPVILRVVVSIMLRSAMATSWA